MFNRQTLKHYEATVVLIAMNIFLFVMTMLQPNMSYGLIKLGGLFSPAIVLHHEYWRFLTAGFLHANLTHLLFNVFSLYAVGIILEPLFKKEHYISIYVLSTIFSNLFAFAFQPTTVVVGASGAIFGLFAVTALLSKLSPNHYGIHALSQQFKLTILINLCLSLLPGISLTGHVGGLLGGVFAFYTFGYFKQNKAKQVLLLIAYIICCIVLYQFGVHQLLQ